MSGESLPGPNAPLVRFLGDAAVVFEASNWQTHILPPAAAVVVDIIVELRQAGPVSSASVAKAIREQLEGHAAATTAIEGRRAIWRIVGYIATSAAVLGAACAGLMLLIRMVVPIPFISRAQFSWITLAAVVLGLPFTLLQSWSWQAGTRRFENWESLDLDEQRMA